MEQIKVVKDAGTTENTYLDFSRKVSEYDDSSIIVFSYEILQMLFQIPQIEELDLESSYIKYDDEEKYDDARIILKSGMKLKFSRVRITTYIYILKSLEFTWNNNSYKYSCPERLQDSTDMCVVTR